MIGRRGSRPREDSTSPAVLCISHRPRPVVTALLAIGEAVIELNARTWQRQDRSRLLSDVRGWKLSPVLSRGSAGFRRKGQSLLPVGVGK